MGICRSENETGLEAFLGDALRAAIRSRELIESANGIRCIHQRGAAAHVGGYAKCLVDFLARNAQLDQRLHVESDARVTARGDAECQCNELLGLSVQHATGSGRTTQLAEAFHDFWRAGAKGNQLC